MARIPAAAGLFQRHISAVARRNARDAGTAVPAPDGTRLAGAILSPPLVGGGDGAGRHPRPRGPRQHPAVLRARYAREREQQSAMGGLYRHRSGRTCAVAVDPADQRRNDRPAAADDLYPARPRGDEHHHRPAALYAGRAPVRPGPGGAVDGVDQWRGARARGHLEVHRRSPGHDRLGRADPDAAPDRADQGVEGEIPDRFPGLSAAHGTGRARRAQDRSARRCR